ncbi:hypothetical protein TrST_g9732 [Triparma strigata]|uniref:UTP--glucose-1-phosphate uridylyltransferase n=1 Tax=Triparma strigata TaxID=1606541 RepID=A0A9W7EM17_9STRA|nr:hypothetical protein TrST_g9732 [Triparma strigata]
MEEEFSGEFGGYSDPYLSLFVPGRICLFGEHTDWSGAFRRFNSSIAVGSTIVSGTNQGLFARVRKHSSKLIVHSLLPSNLNPDDFCFNDESDRSYTITKTGDHRLTLEAEMESASLKAIAVKGGFFSYAAGVACKILTDYKVSGLEVDNYKSTLPVAKGLSSSAAVCVLMARAFNRVFELKGTTRFEMEYAYSGENLTPSRCGRMDQACAFGQRLTVLTYDADDLDVKEISVGKPLHYLLVDLAFPGKSTTQILQGLQSAFPFPQDDTQRAAHHLFGAFNLGICERAIEALRVGDAAQLGLLMVEAQREFQSKAQPLCPAQLTMNLANKVLNHPPLQPLIFGGKGVGSQGDGTVQKDRDSVASVISRDFPSMTSLPLTLEPTGKIRKAVILAAGFGNNHYPATAAISIVFFPIVSEGVTKPALLLHVEELDEAGVEEIAIVCQPGDVAAIRALFHNKLSAQNFSKLGPSQKAFAKRLKMLGLKVKIIVQDKQEGMGHAVLCAKEFCNDEPFLLVIAHHLMKSTCEKKRNCFEQLLNAFDDAGGVDTIAVRRVSSDCVSKYGVARCSTYLEPPNLKPMKVTMMKEKPSSAFASENLRTPNLSPDTFLSFFGLYALKPHVFPTIKAHLDSNVRSENGTFNLTDALVTLNKQVSQVNAIEIKGNRYDLTMPEKYVEAVQVMSSSS